MITITTAAAERLKLLCQERPAATPVLRLATIAGGCSGTGYQYDLKLDTTVGENDLVFEGGGAKAVVDAVSYLLLDGVEIDYEDTLMKSGFVIHNPNAVSTCACGRSFQVDGEPGQFPAHR